jgi:thiol-disulfide isomerase/thioredoxin
MIPARREWLILSAVAAGAALAGGVAGALALQSRSGAAELLSSSFHDLSAQPRRLSEWQGRSLLCNFWATWCGPCREELPLLDAAQQQHAHNGLQVVGIGIDNAANIREYVKVVKVGFPLLVGELQAIALMRRLGNRSGGLPFTAVLDRAGRLRHRKLGAYSAAELATEIAALLR